ncbi:hypothetical protein FLM48_21460 [Shewanella sp. Scap07]|uniref:hypothetical protein n=1 Tax=Shewanella sp. Scap07 TaxID=2589987 RepID=UPI0015BEA63C|nr:hypothetical protein [Shewanella sp. Scap07]QLE87414.1 hypothetical protein FLM48_21460 [Shewanella sp. Scap07]
MNLSCMLNESQYQATLYLNDRPYNVLDIGEGHCLIIIVDDIDQYLSRQPTLLQGQRIIIVDISKVLHRNKLYIVEQCLIRDLHLLLDVFWLEEVEIKNEVNHIKIDALYRITAIRNEFNASLKHRQLGHIGS